MKIEWSIAATLALLAAGLAPAAAQQQNTSGRAFVSGTGLDAGTCLRTAPCKTFAYAIGVLPAGGQMVALDTADYGPVTITKAITIASDGGAVAIVHGTGSVNGVTVTAGTSDVVNLHGLDIENVPTGINITSGNVNVEHTIINGGTTGISAGGSGKTTVSNTTITGPSAAGISAGATVVLDRVSLVSTGTSAVVMMSSPVTMANSTIVGWTNGLTGLGTAFVKQTDISGAGTGISVISGAVVSADTTTITGCTTGVAITGTFNSYGNNNIVGNGSNITGSKTPIQPQIGRAGARAVR